MGIHLSRHYFDAWKVCAVALVFTTASPTIAHSNPLRCFSDKLRYMITGELRKPVSITRKDGSKLVIIKHSRIKKQTIGNCAVFATCAVYETILHQGLSRSVELSEDFVTFKLLMRRIDLLQDRQSLVGKSSLFDGATTPEVLKIITDYGLIPSSAWKPKLPLSVVLKIMDAEIQRYLIEGSTKSDFIRLQFRLKEILIKKAGFPPQDFRFASRTWTPEGFLKQYFQKSSHSFGFVFRNDDGSVKEIKLAKIPSFNSTGRNSGEITMHSFADVERLLMQSVDRGLAPLISYDILGQSESNETTQVTIRHAIAVTGYETDSLGNVKTWILKGSWGKEGLLKPVETKVPAHELRISNFLIIEPSSTDN